MEATSIRCEHYIVGHCSKCWGLQEAALARAIEALAAGRTADEQAERWANEKGGDWAEERIDEAMRKRDEVLNEPAALAAMEWLQRKLWEAKAAGFDEATHRIATLVPDWIGAAGHDAAVSCGRYRTQICDMLVDEASQIRKRGTR